MTNQVVDNQTQNVSKVDEPKIDTPTPDLESKAKEVENTVKKQVEERFKKKESPSTDVEEVAKKESPVTSPKPVKSVKPAPED